MRLLATILCTFALTACTTPDTHHAHSSDYPQAAVFDATADAQLDLTVARAMAWTRSTAYPDGEGIRLLAVFGANWCHDSLALAGWLETPRFQALIEQNFEVIYIEAGVPQTGEGRNLDIAEESGVTGIDGTPTLLVLDTDGTLLNSPKDARAWRNAASRSEKEIFTALQNWAHRPL